MSVLRASPATKELTAFLAPEQAYPVGYHAAPGHFRRRALSSSVDTHRAVAQQSSALGQRWGEPESQSKHLLLLRFVASAAQGTNYPYLEGSFQLILFLVTNQGTRVVFPLKIEDVQVGVL